MRPGRDVIRPGYPPARTSYRQGILRPGRPAARASCGQGVLTSPTIVRTIVLVWKWGRESSLFQLEDDAAHLLPLPILELPGRVLLVVVMRRRQGGDQLLLLPLGPHTHLVCLRLTARYRCCRGQLRAAQRHPLSRLRPLSIFRVADDGRWRRLGSAGMLQAVHLPAPLRDWLSVGVPPLLEEPEKMLQLLIANIRDGRAFLVSRSRFPGI